MPYTTELFQLSYRLVFLILHYHAKTRLLSEYLGLKTMLAVVCKTPEGVKALERHDNEGKVNRGAGLHALGSFIGSKIDGRFLVICLEDLRQEHIFMRFPVKSLY